MTPEEMEIAYNIAKALHESYERQAPAYGYRTREASAVPWEDVPQKNKLLMVATVADLLDRKIIKRGDDASQKPKTKSVHLRNKRS